MEWSNNDALVLCRFRRTLTGNSNDNDKDLSTGVYYMFFALGDAISKWSIYLIEKILKDHASTVMCDFLSYT